MFFLTVHHSIDFFSSYQLNAHFLYSITIYMLRYNPQHVSSSTSLIFRRTNCIITSSGIVTLYSPHFIIFLKFCMQFESSNYHLTKVRWTSNVKMRKNFGIKLQP